MKHILLLLSLLTLDTFIFSQAEIQFDTLEYNLGAIVEQSNQKIKKVRFKNTGNEPLLIHRVTTGDGGSYATWSREPILPNEGGEIIFNYDTKRLGPFNKTINIESNAIVKSIAIRIKGEIIRKKTKIKVSQLSYELGTIKFDSSSTFKFYIVNTGTENLYFNLARNFHVDLLSIRIEYINDTVEKMYYERFTKPGDTLLVTGKWINLFGNTGDFMKEISFIYNSTDTLNLYVKGSFIAEKAETKRIKSLYDNGYHLYQYEENKLTKIELFSMDEKLKQVYFLEGSYCIKILTYSYSKSGQYLENEKCFSNGILIDEKRYFSKY